MADLFQGIGKAIGGVAEGVGKVGGEFLASSPIGQRVGMRTQEQQLAHKSQQTQHLDQLTRGAMNLANLHESNGSTPESEQKIRGALQNLDLGDDFFGLVFSKQKKDFEAMKADIENIIGADVEFTVKGGQGGLKSITGRTPSTINTSKEIGSVLNQIRAIDEAILGHNLSGNISGEINEEDKEVLIDTKDYLIKRLKALRAQQSQTQPGKTEIGATQSLDANLGQVPEDAATPENAPTQVSNTAGLGSVYGFPLASEWLHSINPPHSALRGIWGKLDKDKRVAIANALKEQPQKDRAAWIKKLKAEMKSKGWIK